MTDQLQPDVDPQLGSSLQTGSAHQTWKLTLAYDGTDFQGWQVQPGLRTIQGELQSALGRVTGESPLPQGSGRTDAGVHALAQVASFTLRAPIPPENLLRALNRTLPPRSASPKPRTVRSTFHARHSAIAKTYEYRILRAAILRLPVPALPRPLRLRLPVAAVSRRASNCARASLKASTTSSASPQPIPTSRTADPIRTEDPELQNAKAPRCRRRSTIRTIFSSAWEQRPTQDGELLVYCIRGNGFLHHMVRNLVGTMIDVARGQLALAEIPAFSPHAAAPKPAQQRPRAASSSIRSSIRLNHS